MKKFTVVGLVAIGILVGTAGCSDSVGTPAPAPTPAPTTTPIVAPPTTTPTPTDMYSTPQPTVPGDAYDAGGAIPYPTTPGTPVTPGACTIQTGNVTCDQCLQQGCCAQIAACDGDPDCPATDACMAQCYQQYAYNPQVEQQCEQQCFAQHPSGGQKLDALYQCMGTVCGAQCPQY